ncbi:MAG: 50S ribosomal protein L15 [Bacteroidota bacterium]
MELHSLKPAAGSVKKAKRIGRGQGSGRGGTSTRGHKGQGSRSGSTTKPGFEGGQMPLQRRLPKRGFKNPFRIEYTALNLQKLQELSEKLNTTTIDLELLRKNNVISKTERVKVLAKGELKSKMDIKVNAVSATAKAAIEALGGTVTTTDTK